MLFQRYKIEVLSLADNKVKVIYTFKKHVQFFEIISREEAFFTKRLYYSRKRNKEKPECKVSNKIERPVKTLLKYGYFLYWFYGKEIASEKISEFVNLNII